MWGERFNIKTSDGGQETWPNDYSTKREEWTDDLAVAMAQVSALTQGLLKLNSDYHIIIEIKLGDKLPYDYRD